MDLDHQHGTSHLKADFSRHLVKFIPLLFWIWYIWLASCNVKRHYLVPVLCSVRTGIEAGVWIPILVPILGAQSAEYISSLFNEFRWWCDLPFTCPFFPFNVVQSKSGVRGAQHQIYLHHLLPREPLCFQCILSTLKNTGALLLNSLRIPVFKASKSQVPFGRKMFLNFFESFCALVGLPL